MCLCVGEQYCTKQDRHRLLTVRIIWGKTEKGLSLPFEGPHDCLPHILSAQTEEQRKILGHCSGGRVPQVEQGPEGALIPEHFLGSQNKLWAQD